MIDSHLHVVNASINGLKPMPESFNRLMNAPPDEMARTLRLDMERSQIKQALAIGRLEGPADDPLGIHGTLRIATLLPELRVIGVADPRKTDAAHFKLVDAQLTKHRSKIVALKCYLGYLPFGPEHPNYLPYYKLARQHGLPVVFHTGDNWSTKAKVKYAHPLLVDEVAVDHPEVSFVIAHLGNPWLIDAAEVIYKNDNVWADLSGLFVGDAETLKEMIQLAGDETHRSGLLFDPIRRALAYTERPDRILYGSDWPLAPMLEYRQLIEALVPPEHHEAVFQTNAEKLFGLKS